MTSVELFKKRDAARKKYVKLMDANPDFSGAIFSAVYDWGFYDAIITLRKIKNISDDDLKDIKDKDLTKYGNILWFGSDYKYNSELSPEENWEKMKIFYLKKGIVIGEYKKPTKKEMARIDKILKSMYFENGLIKVKKGNKK